MKTHQEVQRFQVAMDDLWLPAVKAVDALGRVFGKFEESFPSQFGVVVQSMIQ